MFAAAEDMLMLMKLKYQTVSADAGQTYHTNTNSHRKGVSMGSISGFFN